VHQERQAVFEPGSAGIEDGWRLKWKLWYRMS
jgi:hypothetical protein